jgi:hypothetical protein
VSVNKYRPHIFILPEDDANRELANGFQMRVNWSRQIRVLPVAGGWNLVLERFKSEHVTEMNRNPHRFMILLIDFDGREDRVKTAKNIIPGNLADRVFVLGTWTEPEDLREDLGAFEDIGSKLADDCSRGTNATWSHRFLQHNESERQRLRASLCSILYSDSANAFV